MQFTNDKKSAESHLTNQIFIVLGIPIIKRNLENEVLSSHFL